MTERAFRYRLDPQHNTSFGLAILQSIATSPADDVLRQNLVLKGGAALLLVYGSGRATRHDLDFDVMSDTEIGRQPLLALLARLRSPWGAQIKPGAPKEGFEIFEDALNIGPIEFRHQRQSMIAGELTLQISRRKVPPYLAELIRPFTLKGPDGTPFQSPIASLEVIASIARPCR